MYLNVTYKKQRKVTQTLQNYSLNDAIITYFKEEEGQIFSLDENDLYNFDYINKYIYSKLKKNHKYVIKIKLCGKFEDKNVDFNEDSLKFLKDNKQTLLNFYIIGTDLKKEEIKKETTIFERIKTWFS